MGKRVTLANYLRPLGGTELHAPQVACCPSPSRYTTPPLVFGSAWVEVIGKRDSCVVERQWVRHPRWMGQGADVRYAQRMEIEGRGGQIRVDERAGTLTITRAGIVLKPIWGNKPPSTIAFNDLTGLHLQTATVATHGYISFGIRGAAYLQGKITPAPVGDPRAVTFVKRQQPAFERLYHFLLHHAPSLAGRAATGSISPSPQPGGFAAKALRAATGVGPLDVLLQSVLQRAHAAAQAGQTRVTVTFNQADIGVRNTFDQAVSYLATGLEQHGLSVAQVHGSGWDHTRVVVVDLPSVAAPAAPDLATQLSRLVELHRSGSLSEDEFAAAKARLLSS